MADAPNFAKLVPGFDFLQTLVSNAGSALPSIGQWVAPTLNPDELEKRIEELRTVQFWLEQNARMLGATIQALEVQRMTLSTLQTMNVQMADLRESLTIRLPETTKPTAAPPAPAPVAETPAAPARKKPAAKTARADGGDAAKSAAAGPAGLVDPMQWWGALTKQFTQLATQAMKDTTAVATKNLAGATVKPSNDSAQQATQGSAAAPGKGATKAAGAARRRKATEE
jgi:hypothetical protein